MIHKREIKYFLLIFLLVPAYWLLTEYYFETPAFSTRITTTTALITAVTFWMQLKRTENLNEANFIMNLNNQFISNKELSAVEHELEVYYNNTKGKSAAEIDSVPLGLNLDPTSADYQHLVNYLVYLESLSAIVQRGVLHLGVIDDLFAYRFFIAVNNPIIQKRELLPNATFYQGCFKLSALWTKKWERTRTIPFGDYPLYLCPVHLKDKPFVSEEPNS